MTTRIFSSKYLFIPFTIGIILLSSHLNAQYYSSAFGKNGAVLKTALHNIIKGHTVLTYSDLWTAFYTTDKRGSNQVWDIYSDRPNGTPPYIYTLGTNQCGTYSKEGDCYNREHTWPDNYFGGNTPMHTDIQHIFPTDGHVNGMRGSLPYGKVNVIADTSKNGSKTGSSSTYSGSSSDVFEPIDSFKGDLARVYFYMSTRYEGEDGGWLNWEMANGATLTPDAITLLLSWHHLDPVSPKEIARNNAVFILQNNRNPFIDYPQFADCIWGTADCTSLGLPTWELANQLSVYPNPVIDFMQVESNLPLTIISCAIYNFTGQEVIKRSNLNHQIDLSNLKKGVYLLNVQTDKGLIRKKIVKE